MSLTVLHAPLKSSWAAKHPNVVRDQLAAHRPTMVGLTEAYPGPVRQMIREDLTKDFRQVVEHGGSDSRRGQYDNPILVRADLRSLGSGQVFGAEASQPERIAPERWFTWSTVVVDGRPVFYLTMHPHAGVQSKVTGRLNGTARAAEFAAQMKRLDALLTFAEAMGWDIVVSGDANFRDHGGDASSPYRILRAHGLVVFVHGLDFIASTKRLRLTVTKHTAPRSITDHPWLKATNH